ncbi:tyrosine-type recombinase/integrase [Saccharopolyspora sp. 6V]|uniref:tyrosine-type recombinase/integrase n=1 Tax=Saccharopolyspora sp. 6V TaxID=2877239 RepID=UPI001CD57813|nr:tyrosine-type recombinase/integrase [Saccharopolyspora sp. 6V]MCA1194888.1 site-specific integrase [Saccharopolyspora sp. 6V]
MSDNADKAKKSRNANGRSSIYLGKDGYWHGRVSMGVGDDGKPVRPHVKRKAKEDVVEEVSRLERARDEGRPAKTRRGKFRLVEDLLIHWVEEIAPLTVRYKTLLGYRTAIYKHLVPGIGAHRLDRIQEHPEYFEKLYRKLLQAGFKPATVHQVHRTGRTAFGEALRRGYINRNPLALAKAPRVEEEEIEPLEPDEVQQVLKAALERRNGVRYVVALALGIRQGEALGLKWPRLDRRKKALKIREAIQRRTWEHGCSDPHACGAKYHKVKPCPKLCKRHTRACPPPCPADCTDHARWCPQRRGGGLVLVELKSSAGRRSIGLPDELFDMLLRHEEQQQAERELAGNEWHEGGFMFTQPNGKPLDPRRDLDEWKELLTEAGVREARLHDARHTAATTLLILGVPDRTVMDLMGWSTPSMKKRYMHVTDEIRRDVASQLNGFFWGRD